MDFALAKDDSRSVGMHKQKVRACLPTNVQGLREHKRDESLRIQSTFVMQSSAMPEITRCRRVTADVGKSGRNGIFTILLIRQELLVRGEGTRDEMRALHS